MHHKAAYKSNGVYAFTISLALLLGFCFVAFRMGKMHEALVKMCKNTQAVIINKTTLILFTK